MIDIEIDLTPWAEMYISGRGLADWVRDLDNWLHALPALKNGGEDEIFLRECIFGGVRTEYKAKNGPEIAFRFMRNGSVAHVGVESLSLDGINDRMDDLHAARGWSNTFGSLVWRFSQVEFEERMARGCRTLTLTVYPL